MKLVTRARRQREDKAPSILNIEPQQRSCETISRLAGGDRIPIDQQTIIFHRQLDCVECEIARHRSRPLIPEARTIEGYLHDIYDFDAGALVNQQVERKGVPVVEHLSRSGRGKGCGHLGPDGCSSRSLFRAQLAFKLAIEWPYFNLELFCRGIRHHQQIVSEDKTFGIVFQYPVNYVLPIHDCLRAKHRRPSLQLGGCLLRVGPGGFALEGHEASFVQRHNQLALRGFLP